MVIGYSGKVRWSDVVELHLPSHDNESLLATRDPAAKQHSLATSAEHAAVGTELDLITCLMARGMSIRCRSSLDIGIVIPA
jgi:hypothetical protein